MNPMTSPAIAHPLPDWLFEVVIPVRATPQKIAPTVAIGRKRGIHQEPRTKPGYSLPLVTHSNPLRERGSTIESLTIWCPGIRDSSMITLSPTPGKIGQPIGNLLHLLLAHTQRLERIGEIRGHIKTRLVPRRVERKGHRDAEWIDAVSTFPDDDPFLDRPLLDLPPDSQTSSVQRVEPNRRSFPNREKLPTSNLRNLGSEGGTGW